MNGEAYQGKQQSIKKENLLFNAHCTIIIILVLILLGCKNIANLFYNKNDTLS